MWIEIFVFSIILGKQKKPTLSGGFFLVQTISPQMERHIYTTNRVKEGKLCSYNGWPITKENMEKDLGTIIRTKILKELKDKELRYI